MTTTTKESPGTAVAKKAPLTLKQMIDAAEAEIQAVLPAHMDAKKVVRAARLAIAQTPALEKCDPKTVLFSLMAAARLGLEINSPLGECWLIPYGTECTLQIGYRGYQGLARRGGDISHIEARVVYEGDEFDYQLGTDPKIVHKPKGENGAESLTHAYAIAFPKGGGAPIFDVLTKEDIERARKSSRMADGPAWKNHTGEMWRKTAVRRLAKYLPLSPEMAAAIEMDLRGETGEVQSPTPLIDSPASLNATVAERTQAQLDELRNKLGGSSQATPAAVSAESPATATAAPKASSDPQPW
ncbi:MAG TPA: recombinase RecT [Gemmatimonadales bacterium]|nr:recombinase RecT [Gemmatimonadales bacterium]